ncbi:unnamed protein product [Sordaria macrospora k-hell]|uniref:WGS project CABT00000000 data, contig 2.8 n=1 Tax=Sordaria macrospora (strain ATCC MYA-333 / DSM 997 / K(L3346) / K-hell) TaxID=771870 RepID=F7VUM6_SORMK|nr:uncharacterized protein SMAC_04981 [Sordaria macrospora k-hell]CCC09222.1 unnamed protein product [Sordaria macrospora k-hell]
MRSFLGFSFLSICGFHGLKTFGNLPYVKCFSDEEAACKKYDIAILGAPFDTAVTGRPGARFGPTGIRVGSQRLAGFDFYTDTWNPDVLGGNISHYAGINHGTFLHIAHEEGLIRNTSIHAGLRAPINKRSDRINDKRCGFSVITARDIDKHGIDWIISTIKARVGDSRVYISVDVDVLDPAFAPGTGTSEPGGWSTRELLTIIDGLRGLSVVGADVVEVSPAYDNSGETTVLAAAQVGLSLVSLMVAKPVRD